MSDKESSAGEEQAIGAARSAEPPRAAGPDAQSPSIESFGLDKDANACGMQRFTAAMEKKLKKKHKEGRAGWNNPSECDIEDLIQMLASHIKKGDMVDIANFAMMIWNR